MRCATKLSGPHDQGLVKHATPLQVGDQRHAGPIDLLGLESNAIFDATDAVRKAADLLADYGWLAREAIPTGAAGGRPTERYLIHPAMLNGGHA